MWSENSLEGQLERGELQEYFYGKEKTDVEKGEKELTHPADHIHRLQRDDCAGDAAVADCKLIYS